MPVDVSAVLLDLDDTLYPETEFVKSGFEAVAAQVSHNGGVSEEDVFDFLWSEFQHGVRGNNLDRLVAEYEIDSDVQELVEVYRYCAPDISLFPDAEHLLRHTETIRRAIVTNGDINKQQNKIDALGLRERVDAIYISGEYPPTEEKPAPTMFHRCLKELTVLPERAAYIGDNPAIDFAGPNALGMTTIHVRRPEGIHAGETAPAAIFEPDIVVDDLHEAVERVTSV